MLPLPPIPAIPPFTPRPHLPADDFGFDESDQVLATEPLGGGGTFTPPLWLVMVNATNVKVVFGQIAGLTPTGINANIDVSSSDGTWAIYLDLTLNDDGTVSAVTVSTSSAGTVPAHASDHAYFLVGEVDVTDGEITTVRPSLAFTNGFAACGRDTADPATTRGTYSLYVGSN